MLTCDIADRGPVGGVVEELPAVVRLLLRGGRVLGGIGAVSLGGGGLLFAGVGRVGAQGHRGPVVSSNY